MQNIVVKPSQIKGIVKIPPSKSHTMRSILFASMAQGTSRIVNYLPSPDTNAILKACNMMGARITANASSLEITGVNGKPKVLCDVVNAQNSGQIIYYIGALSSLIEGYTVITGDTSIRTNRPVRFLLKGIQQLSGYAISTRDNDLAPIIIKGPIKPGKVIVSGKASLPVSALLIVSSFLEGETEIIIQNPGEKPWVNLTLSWLDRGQVKYKNDNFKKIVVYGKGYYPSFNYTVPSDFSTAAFPIVSALITNSNLTLVNMDMDDVQGDKQLISVLKEMGADIKYDGVNKLLHINNGCEIVGRTININDFIDSITVLAVLGCFAKGKTKIIGATPSRYKECDRITCIFKELRKMGADIHETEDGLIINQSKLFGAEVDSYGDHRMALAVSVAGLAAKGSTKIINTECIEKSFPAFVSTMTSLGAQMYVDSK